MESNINAEVFRFLVPHQIKVTKAVLFFLSIFPALQYPTPNFPIEQSNIIRPVRSKTGISLPELSTIFNPFNLIID